MRACVRASVRACVRACVLCVCVCVSVCVCVCVSARARANVRAYMDSPPLSSFFLSLVCSVFLSLEGNGTLIEVLIFFLSININRVLSASD